MKFAVIIKRNRPVLQKIIKLYQIGNTVRQRHIGLCLEKQPGNRMSEVNLFEHIFADDTHFDIFGHKGQRNNVSLMFFNNVLIGTESGLIRAVRAERMPVFVSDDKKVFCFDVKIPMKPRLNQFVQKFGIARGISRLTNLAMVYITAAAAGFIASLSYWADFQPRSFGRGQRQSRR